MATNNLSYYKWKFSNPLRVWYNKIHQLGMSLFDYFPILGMMQLCSWPRLVDRISFYHRWRIFPQFLQWLRTGVPWIRQFFSRHRQIPNGWRIGLTSELIALFGQPSSLQACTQIQTRWLRLFKASLLSVLPRGPACLSLKRAVHNRSKRFSYRPPTLEQSVYHFPHCFGMILRLY